MPDKTDGEFEAWWIKQPFGELYVDWKLEEVKGKMRNVWRASRAEMVIELPKPMKAPPYTSRGWNDMRVEAIDAIEAAGAKWRE